MDFSGILKAEMSSELTDNILKFWLNQTKDRTYGGYLGQIDHFGNVVENAPKGSVLNARILWTFSAAYKYLGDKKYLSAATRAYEYISEYFIDKNYGGVFWKLDHLGNPLDSRKQIYASAFTIYGLTEYYLVSRSPKVLDLAITLFNTIENYSFDKVNNGYFEAFTFDWKTPKDMRLSEKDNNESKTMNTHLHILEAYTALYRIWKDNNLAKSLKNLIELFLNKFINSDYNLNLFFNDEWELKSDLISYGHDIECSWLLQEAADVLDDSALLKKVKESSLKMAEKNLEGLDENNGLIYEFSPSENVKDSDKHWWVQAEAIVGYYNAYQLSGDIKYLSAVEDTWKFIKEYIIDRENGEWFWSVDSYGFPHSSEEKTGIWKCPYHNGRACFEIMNRIK